MIPNNVKVVSTETVPPYIVSVCDDGLLYVRVTNMTEETVERAKELVETIGKLVNYKKVPMISMFDEFALPPKENRIFWAQEDSCPYTSAEAFVADTIAIKLIANFYVQNERPQRKTKIFTDVNEARMWLKTFL